MRHLALELIVELDDECDQREGEQGGQRVFLGGLVDVGHMFAKARDSSFQSLP
jgi:hypothetical protein